jgi:hypothetical protein
MKYRKNDQWLEAGVQDEMLLMCANSGAFRTLNHTGTLLWSRLGEPSAATDLAASLASEFEVGEEQALCDVEAWIAEMCREGMVSAVEG